MWPDLVLVLYGWQFLLDVWLCSKCNNSMNILPLPPCVLYSIRAQNGHGPHRPCKIVLLTLAAPRGVTDLYLSWGIIIEHAAYCLHSSWYPLCLHFGFGVLTVGAWVGISLALSSDFSGILLRRWSSNPFCLDFGFWFFCFGLGPCFIGCFALGSSFGGRFGLWPYPWSLDLTMRCGGIYSRLRCFE